MQTTWLGESCFPMCKTNRKEPWLNDGNLGNTMKAKSIKRHPASNLVNIIFPFLYVRQKQLILEDGITGSTMEAKSI